VQQLFNNKIIYYFIVEGKKKYIHKFHFILNLKLKINSIKIKILFLEILIKVNKFYFPIIIGSGVISKIENS
jgi:hypothetical protein